MNSQTLIILAIALVAATVNGALGYGFSSITVPLALLIVSNRVLNPALVLVEVVLNAYALWVNRDALSRVWRRAMPVVLGLAPGIVVGTIALTRVSPSWLKLATFACLLPLILLQAIGFRRPIRSERTASVGFGTGIGALYAITTISGPPLAMFLNNQGFAKQEFRAALGLIRVVEATLACIVYARAGVFTTTSFSMFAAILPSVIVGVPIGAWLIHRVPPDVFRRWCMSFDAAIVAFAASALLRELQLVRGMAAYALFVVVLLLDVLILCRFSRRSSRPIVASVSPDGASTG
jgi:uncharacterized membrane protein YfcA